MPEHFTTACPRNCYSTCSLRVQVEGGRVRRIEPHPGDEATAGGPCLKGLAYVERVHSPDRILRPLRRQPGRTTFRPISWDEALDEIVGHLRRLRDTSGPRSVLYYQASGTKGLLNRVGRDFWRRFGGCTTTYGDLCWPAGLEATRLTLGDNRHSAPADIANARLIVLWGKNPAETNLHQMPFIDQALERGAKLVVIDPRRTQSAERAALLIQPRPGTDGALALAVAHHLIAMNGTDRAFIADHVHGYASFARAIEPCTVAWASAITDVPERHIRELAEDLARLRPATICAGYGMQRYTNSGQTMRALLALLAITGNIGRPGAGWVYANLQSHVFDPVRDPVASFPPEEDDRAERVSISTARLGLDMRAQQDPALRMAWVERGNPVSQNPQTASVLEAFRALEFRVVVDQFLTDTAREADLVLPAKSFLEQSDVITAYWRHDLQLKQKVLEPPGEVKPESAIYRLLAARLDLDGANDPGVFPVSDAEVDAYLARALAPWPEVTLARLREGPVTAPGAEAVAFADLIFPTPSGKIELLSEEAARRWGVADLPSFQEPVESTRRPPPSAAQSGGPSAEPNRGPNEPPLLNLLTPNTKNRIHSQFGNLEMIRAVSDDLVVDIHPDDAGARGIREREPVRVHNARGEIRLPARITNGIKPGSVSIPNGAWAADGAAVNSLSAARETDLGHGAAFHDNLVQVERVRNGG